MQPDLSAESATDELLGVTIRRLRTAQDLSLRELAERAGVDYSMLSKVERGLVSPSRRWLKEVAEALGHRLGEAA